MKITITLDEAELERLIEALGDAIDAEQESALAARVAGIATWAEKTDALFALRERLDAHLPG